MPRLAALFKKHGVEATFYFSVGPDHTGRALRRVFRKGFAQKVARTSVLKHYGLKTLMYGVLLPGPDIGRHAQADMRAVRDAGFEVGLHTYDHVRWQDRVARRRCGVDPRANSSAGLHAFERIFGFSAAIACGGRLADQRARARARTRIRLALCERYPRRRAPSCRCSADGPSPCPQIPTTLPTFDELLGRDGIDEANDRGRACFDCRAWTSAPPLQVFTLHAELEGMLLRDAFESLLVKWRDSGASHHRHGGHSRARLTRSIADSRRRHGRSPRTLGRARRSGSGRRAGSAHGRLK